VGQECWGWTKEPSGAFEFFEQFALTGPCVDSTVDNVIFTKNLRSGIRRAHERPKILTFHELLSSP
jgi:hypothetical protein